MSKIGKKNLNRALRKNRNRAAIFGTAEKPRLSVFRSNKYTYVQLIDDAKGHTLAAASSRELLNRGKPAKGGSASGGKAELAKSLGGLIAEKAKKLGVKSAVFNRSFYKYHGRIKAVAEAAREAGLKI